jgi:DNA invertase Pin-like site-specific DNA recombinase
MARRDRPGRLLRTEVHTQPTKNGPKLPLLKDANLRLTPLIYVNSTKTKKRKSKRLSKEQQAKKYQRLLDSGKVKNKAALARKFGVSRAWVSKVLNLYD